ncbi:hypothetical protein HDU83_006927, partial [Entophlyctis luteolus]
IPYTKRDDNEHALANIFKTIKADKTKDSSATLSTGSLGGDFAADENEEDETDEEEEVTTDIHKEALNQVFCSQSINTHLYPVSARFCRYQGLQKANTCAAILDNFISSYASKPQAVVPPAINFLNRAAASIALQEYISAIADCDVVLMDIFSVVFSSNRDKLYDVELRSLAHWLRGVANMQSGNYSAAAADFENCTNVDRRKVRICRRFQVRAAKDLQSSMGLLEILKDSSTNREKNEKNSFRYLFDDEPEDVREVTVEILRRIQTLWDKLLGQIQKQQFDEGDSGIVCTTNNLTRMLHLSPSSSDPSPSSLFRLLDPFPSIVAEISSSNFHILLPVLFAAIPPKSESILSLAQPHHLTKLVEVMLDSTESLLHAQQLHTVHQALALLERVLHDKAGSDAALTCCVFSGNATKTWARLVDAVVGVLAETIGIFDSAVPLPVAVPGAVVNALHIIEHLIGGRDSLFWIRVIADRPNGNECVKALQATVEEWQNACVGTLNANEVFMSAANVLSAISQAESPGSEPVCRYRLEDIGSRDTVNALN